MTSRRGWKVARLGLMIVVLVLAFTVASYASTITGLVVKKTDEKVEIHLSANGPLRYRVLTTNKPRQALIVEMPSASVLKQVMSKKVIQIDKGIIERAKIQRYKPGVVRLVVEVLHPAKYYIKAAPGKKGFILVVGTQTIAAKVSKAVPSMGAGEPTIESPKPVKPPVAIKSQPRKRTAYKHENIRPKRDKPRRSYIKKVSIDFVNADLLYVVKLLAQEMNLNLVTDESVQGAVSLSLKNVPATTALKIILNLHDLKKKRIGSILFVGSEETIETMTPESIGYDPMLDWQFKIQVFHLSYVSPDSVMGEIKKIFPMINVYPAPQGNAVIVQSKDSYTLRQVRNMIAGLDVEQPKVETPAPPAPPPIKVEVVRLRYNEASSFLPTLKELLGGDAPPVMAVDKHLNALVCKGTEDQIGKLKEYLEITDLPLPQVMLSVKVVDLSETGAKNLGVNWQVGSQDGTQPIKFYEIPHGYPPPGTTYDPYTATQPASGAPLPVGFFVRDPFVLQASLALQVTSGEAKVLASPRVATMSGIEATLHIGEKYPIVYYDPRAGQYQVIYVDIGIKLTVKPTITPDGYIEAKIKPTVSNLLELINNQYPRTAERSADVTVRVKDGNTIVIGGMVDESYRTSVTKIPLLGDIPILGQMFRSRSMDRSKKEVVIMITPKIMPD